MLIYGHIKHKIDYFLVFTFLVLPEHLHPQLKQLSFLLTDFSDSGPNRFSSPFPQPISEPSSPEIIFSNSLDNALELPLSTLKVNKSLKVNKPKGRVMPHRKSKRLFTESKN